MGHEIGIPISDGESLRQNGIDPSHHFVLTHKMVELGSGSPRAKSHFPIMHIGGCRRRGG